MEMCQLISEDSILDSYLWYLMLVVSKLETGWVVGDVWQQIAVPIVEWAVVYTLALPLQRNAHQKVAISAALGSCE